MGLDARRGAGFPPELYEDIVQGWKTKRNEADKPIVQAVGESLGEMAAIHREDHRCFSFRPLPIPRGFWEDTAEIARG